MSHLLQPHQFRLKASPAIAGERFRLPFISLAIVLTALPFSLFPELFQLGYFNRTLIQQGEYWRLVTGHLSHTSISHMSWDLLAFVLAAGYLEQHSRRQLLSSLLAGLLSVDALLLFPGSGVNSYAGLSGLLFAPLLISLIVFAKKQPSLNGWLPLLICLGKLIWELFSGEALLSQSPWPPYPPAHLAGTLGGVLMLIFLPLCQGRVERQRKPKTAPPHQRLISDIDLVPDQDPDEYRRYFHGEVQ